MSQFIDRRLNGKNKSTVNRQRFIRRFKGQIKEAVSNAIAGRSITDIDSGEKVTIPARDLSEPLFHHGQGGQRDIVHPGNKEFVTGDQIQRPPNGGGQGGNGHQASNEGEGQDDFGFQISREEFLDIFFEDLELPNLIKKQVNQIESFKWIRAGYSTDGVPANINIVRSLRGAIGRRQALGGAYKGRIQAIEDEIALIEADPSADRNRLTALREELDRLCKKKSQIPFIDTLDLRYNNRVKQIVPSSNAVMFCLMDVSGSMDELKKDIAKRFFILLYLFLNKTYKKIEVVFIRHHTSAKEVAEQEFFYSRETGGTVVSSALELMAEVIRERYQPHEWNIYAAQASDGDNWNNDSPRCREILAQQILPAVQYYAYVEIMPRHHQSLWEAYQTLQAGYPHFAMEHIEQINDIYPVFRELFKRQQA